MAKSMGMNLASGLQGMLKEGHSSYEGVDDAILRNINAAKELAAIVRTSLGPNGEQLELYFYIVVKTDPRDSSMLRYKEYTVHYNHAHWNSTQI